MAVKYTGFSYFKDLPLGADFIWSGYKCHKRSTRTADIGEAIDGGSTPGRWFYFDPLDQCHTGYARVAQ